MEVSLQWTDIDIDMDLRVNFTGFHDVQDICEGFEHFYSPSSNDGYIPEGLYPVYVTYAADKDINASLREYQDIIVRIKVPGHDETRVVSLKVLDSLNNGHIADIKVEKQKVKVVLKDDFQRSSTVIYYGSNGGWALSGGSSGGSGGGYYGGGGSSGGWGYTYTPAPIDQGYIYSIIWHLREVVFGPLAGADISIYAINDYNMTSGIGVNPIHTDKTSYGSSVNTAGIITIPNEIFEALDDEKLYVVEAKGGMDIDVNDDRVTDAVPTINVGKARVVMSGSALKNIGFKINILTEMAYQISKKYYNENDLSKFIDKSDEAVKCLLKKDINLDEQINTADALYFTPYSDMDGLYGSFRNEFMPIITDIYSGKDIYENSFNLYARALIKAENDGYFTLNENLPKGTIIGKINRDCVSESDIYAFRLIGEGAENFEVDVYGNLKVSQNANIVYENKRIYGLSVIGTNAYGNSPAESIYITVTADNSPIITMDRLVNYLFENMPNGSHMGTITVNDMGYQVTGMRLEGYGAEYFNINKNGEITVAHGENITLNDKVYRLTAIASNAFGDSAPSQVIFNIYDDVPVILGNVYTTIQDNATSGTAIGKPSYQEGLTPIKEFRLTGFGAQNFDISTDGTITIAQNAAFVAESSPYILEITAVNEQGRSKPAQAVINVVSSVIEHSITLEPLNVNIYVNAQNGTQIGGVRYGYSYAAPDAFSLSGTGSERFSISSNGVITLSDNRNLNVGDIFDLEANASNEYASSAKTAVKITVIDDYLTLYGISVSIMEGLEAGTAIGKVGYSYGVSPAVSFELEGADAAYFTIDSGGVIKLSSVLNYDTKQEYSFDIKAVNAEGKTSSSKAFVTVIDDAPILADTTLNIMENSYGGEAAGYVRVKSSGKSPINSFTLSGTGSELFNIDASGLIKTAIGAKIDYETKSVYNLKAAASNAYDTSKAVNVTINVVNAPDEEPVLIPTTLSVDENSPKETVVGNVGIFSHGSEAIVSFTLTGTNSDWFGIDSSGKITVTDLAKLDFEVKKVFNLKVKASNIYGDSNIVDLMINVNNVPDSPPVISSSTFYVDENSPVETFVGQLNINDDGSPITSITLSGNGAENFKVYNNGTIVVAEGAELDYESKSSYYLSAKVANIFGESNTVNVRIYLSNIKDTAPVLQDTHFSIHKKTPANKTIGAIIVNSAMHCDITEYVSGDNSVFDVKDNGEVYTKTAVTEGNNYTVNVYAKSLCGDSNTISLTIDTQNRIIGQIDTGGYTHAVALSSDETKAFVSGDHALKIVDVSDIFNPAIIGQIATGGHVRGVTLSLDNTKIFAATDHYGSSFKIIDVSGHANPTLISQINTDYHAYAVALSSDETKAFVANYHGGLRIIDVSDPVKPAVIGRFDADGYVSYDVILSSDETKVFVFTSGGDLKIIDVSNPQYPAFIGQISMGGHAKAVTLSSDNTKAFVVAGNGSLRIIDVSDPVKPVSISQIGGSHAYAVTLSSDETKAFVADYDGSLKIIDVSDPKNPTTIGQIDTDSVINIVLSSDETKVFAGTYNGLFIIDIEDFTKD